MWPLETGWCNGGARFSRFWPTIADRGVVKMVPEVVEERGKWGAAEEMRNGNRLGKVKER